RLLWGRAWCQRARLLRAAVLTAPARTVRGGRRRPLPAVAPFRRLPGRPGPHWPAVGRADADREPFWLLAWAGRLALAARAPGAGPRDGGGGAGWRAPGRARAPRRRTRGADPPARGPASALPAGRPATPPQADGSSRAPRRLSRRIRAFGGCQPVLRSKPWNDR